MAQKPIAVVTSRTAEVFALDEHRVLKLYHAGADEDAAREAHVVRLVETTGVRCPEMLGRVERDGRAGILYGRLYGPSLARWLGLRRPWRIRAAAHILARAHAELDAYHAPELPSLRDRLWDEIQLAHAVPAPTRALALATIEALPDDDRLCHCDLTTDNVLLTPGSPTVIDWLEAARGDPAADVAHSLIHLAVAHTYYLSAARRPLAQQMHAWLAAAYSRHYQLLRPDTAQRVQTWLLPVAVARLGCGVPISPAFLLGLIARLAQRAEAV